jgi:hypothetical protein
MMLQAKINSMTSGVERRYTITTIDKNTIKQARKVFNKYKDKKVILNEDFSDNTWKTTNQIATVSFRFEYSCLDYHKNAKQWIGCSYQYFLKATKTYIVLKLGSISLIKLQQLIRDFHNLLSYSYTDILDKKMKYCEHTLELLKILSYPCQDRDLVIETIEESNVYKKNNKKQRLLANFSTYFTFHDVMNNFWNHASNTLKLQYFPLRLWWTLTSILPLRPTEFLLIPHDCIAHVDGQWILSIRRTTLKGGPRKKTYRINEDYEVNKYIITSAMCHEILEYMESTKDMVKSKLDTLFIQEPHNMLVGQNVSNNNHYYSYTNLSTCLKKFQEQYIQNQNSNSVLINLGDTRHIAMINLIISGGSPTICKELAGHHDINISSHYYSNISKFIECATYEAYKKSLDNTATIRKHRPKSLKHDVVKVDAGYCDSDKFSDGSIDDCIKHMDSNGEIGNCMECPHLIDGKHGMYIAFTDPKKRKNQVDHDSKALIEAIDSVRKGIGFNEDIQSALLRLQHSSTWYRECLKKELEVNENGKTT